MKQSQIFRKVSLDRLSSPEQLDQLLQVTTPIGWISLIALIALLASAVIWGVFGTIPTKVIGVGILIKSGGVFKVIPESAGHVSDIRVHVGDFVRKGQIIARVAQPDILDKLRDSRMNLVELEKQHDLIYQYRTEDIKLQLDSIEEKRKYLKLSIISKESQLKWLEERKETQKQLLKEGLITKQTLNDTEQKIASLKVDIKQTHNELHELSIRELQSNNQREQDLLNIQQKINIQKTTIASLEDNLDSNTKVACSYTGRVLEIMVDVGDFVRPDSTILNLELVGKDIKLLEAKIYVPAMDGKKIRPGMNAQISPSTVKREEFGFIRGSVISVSEFPATHEGMLRTLNNENLVRMLAGKGAPVEVTVDLIPDSNTLSGYKWSSPKGPPMRVHSGTMCSSNIIVKEQSPISLVIPLTKKYLLGL